MVGGQEEISPSEFVYLVCICRSIMSYRKSAVERIMWLKMKLKQMEASKNGQEEEVEVEVQLTYLRYYYVKEYLIL